ncbi:MAG: Amino-acid carrier protein AlsT [Calditrichaeota bacterium]|nr:Amino-acid carrier protein AlsT [Calditrichota bacterium]
MQEWIDTVSSYFATFLIIPLIGTGIYLTWRLKLVQLMHFRHSWKVISGVYDSPEDTGDVNHLQALSAALSATIGIGNIAGVATAIHFGGPGALFWMWVTAALGMATKFSEATLAMVFRKEHQDGSVSGGPMYYIEQGIGRSWKPLAVIFAGATIISSFGTGNAIQAFTVADSMRADFGIPPWLTGLVIATVVALVIVGGIRRIGIVASRLVPFMAALYILGCLFVISMNITEVPATFGLIFESAFTTQGAVGGFAGSTFFMALLWGVRRGIYSNESGQGSAPIAHAAAKTEEPVREGTVAMVGPFIDTLLICTLTGLTIITSGAWNGHFPESVATTAPKVVHAGAELQPGGDPLDEDLFDGDLVIEAGIAQQDVEFVYANSFLEAPRFVRSLPDGGATSLKFGQLKVEQGKVVRLMDESGADISGETVIEARALQNGSVLTSFAFQSSFARHLGEPMGRFGSWIVTFGVLLFAISTAISWSYYGDRAVLYLFGRRGVRLYRWIFVLVIFTGSNLALAVVWGFGDIALSIMATPNLIALLLLAPKLVKLKQEYFSREHKPVMKAHWWK